MRLLKLLDCLSRQKSHDRRERLPDPVVLPPQLGEQSERAHEV